MHAGRPKSTKNAVDPLEMARTTVVPNPHGLLRANTRKRSGENTEGRSVVYDSGYDHEKAYKHTYTQKRLSVYADGDNTARAVAIQPSNKIH